MQCFVINNHTNKQPHGQQREEVSLCLQQQQQKCKAVSSEGLPTEEAFGGFGSQQSNNLSVSAWMFKRDGGRHKLAPSIINNMAAFTLKLSANLSVRKKKGKTCWLCKQNTFLLFRQNWGRTEVREEQMWRPTRDTGTSETLSDETETDFCGFDLNKAGKYSAPAAETWQENPTRD